MPEKTCSTCQCNKVCDHNKYGFENCGNYISDDVVPRAEIASGGTSCHWCEDKIKDDTVRKMVERLKEKAMDVDMDDAALWMECVTIEDVNQIAKELLEENT